MKKLVLLIIFAVFVVSFGCSEKKEPSMTKGKVVKNDNVIVNSLTGMLDSYPPVIQQSILSEPGKFLSLISKVLLLPRETFIMADKQHALGENFTPDDLVSLSEYPDFVLSRKTLKLRKIAIPDLLKMVHDAENAGITLVISSTYRSYQYQKKVFAREVKLYGLKTAERESARPGTSQHQLGVAIDFGSISDAYASTPAGKWLLKNAWKYGFSLSYPKGYEWLTGYRPEVWHYRYISPEAAKIQKVYFNDIQYYLLLFLNSYWDELYTLI